MDEERPTRPSTPVALRRLSAYPRGMGVVNLSQDAAVAVTPHDSNNDPKGPFNSLLVWVAGTVSFQDEAGNSSGTSGSLAAGTLIPVKAVRVNSTGTTATVLGLIGVQSMTSKRSGSVEVADERDDKRPKLGEESPHAEEVEASKDELRGRVADAQGASLRDDSPPGAPPGSVMTLNSGRGGDTCGGGYRSGRGRCGGRVVAGVCTVCGVTYDAPPQYGVNVDMGVTA